jgi:hypothetical protein
MRKRVEGKKMNDKNDNKSCVLNDSVSVTCSLSGKTTHHSRINTFHLWLYDARRHKLDQSSKCWLETLKLSVKRRRQETKKHALKSDFARHIGTPINFQTTHNASFDMENGLTGYASKQQQTQNISSMRGAKKEFSTRRREKRLKSDGSTIYRDD